jgi:iron complex transport system ATP-binding protein
MSAAISARGLAFGYRSAEPVLRGIDLDANAGELVCLLGPNGGGKTTLLRCLLGLAVPSSGTVTLDGRPLAGLKPRERARRLAYVPQSPASAFAFTAREIVLMGRLSHLGVLGLAGAKDLEIVRAAMEMTGTEALAGRTLDELSGGEAQRVMIARALAQQPTILLLDEPTSHLDLRHQMSVTAMLRRVARDWPMAVLCVSHDLNVAARFADRLVLIAGGRVAADGPPDSVLRADLLREVYGIEVDLVPRPDPGPPLVIARPPESPAGAPRIDGRAP